MKIKLRFR